MNLDKPKISIGIKIPKRNFKSLKLEEYLLKIYLNSILDVNFGSTSLLLEELQKGNIVDDLEYSMIESNDYYVIFFISSTFYPEYFKDKVIDKFNKLSQRQILQSGFSRDRGFWIRQFNEGIN